MSIQYWNRRQGRMETENVYGDFFVRLLYGNPLGFFVADSLFVRKAVSRLYGGWQSASSSQKKIQPFVERFQIPMEQYAPGPFGSFNEFFIRPFKAGQRSFPKEENLMGAFAEGRYLAFADSSAVVELPVKGLGIDPLVLLGKTPGKERFRGGACLLARLCPVDYHRFHFPDAGQLSHFHEETGKLHSVNPLALSRHPELFLTNERHISLLETKNFGCLAYVEVGALCVGKIVQTHQGNFTRGQEKGYFLFGASTVVVYGEKGAWQPEQDLLDRSREGIETLVELGSPVARRSL